MHRKGTKLSNADALSRLPLPDKETVENDYNKYSATQYFCHFVKNIDVAISSEDIGLATLKDEILKQVL